VSNNISILEIRKAKFIENPNKENYLKLDEKIDRHKEIFDNKFFAEATKNALYKKDNYGLLYISRLYIELNRNVEAEFIMSRAHEIDESNNEITYYFFDILCRRKQLGTLSTIGDKLDKSKDELMYIKSLIKYFLLTNREKELDDLLASSFENYKTDREFVWFVLISAIQNNNYHFTYMVSKTMFKKEFFCSLTKQQENRLKNHFYTMIKNLLNEKIYATKNC
jgi:hypothetical protein